MKTHRPPDPFTAARPRPAESVPAHATTPEDIRRAGAPRPVRADTTARAVEVYGKMKDSARAAQEVRVEQQREAFAPQREKVLAAARQGLPVPDAARAGGVPESTARKWIKEAGVTPPKGKPGPKPPAAKVAPVEAPLGPTAPAEPPRCEGCHTPPILGERGWFFMHEKGCLKAPGIAPASGTGRSGQLTRDARIAAGLRGLADAAAALAAALEAP